MGAMILPLSVVFVAAILLLGLMLAERYPVSTWRERLRDLTDAARDTESRAHVVPQEARLEDLMTLDNSAAHAETETFSGLVGVVEKAMGRKAAGATASASGAAGGDASESTPKDAEPEVAPAGSAASAI